MPAPPSFASPSDRLRRTLLARRYKVLGHVTKTSVVQAADLREGEDKGEETKNQKPGTSLYRQNDSGRKSRRHPQPDQRGPDKFHARPS